MFSPASVEVRKKLMGGSAELLKIDSVQKILKRVRNFLDEKIDVKRLAGGYEADINHFETIFREAPAAVCVLEGPDLVFTFANEAYHELLGERRALIGRSALDAVPEFQEQGFVDLLRRSLKENRPYRGNEVFIELKRADGRTKGVFIDYVYQPKRDPNGKVCGVVFIATDVSAQVTARKEAESLAERLQSAVVCRDEFMSIASHELKTPITSLKLQLQMTQRRLPSVLGDGPNAAKISRSIAQSHEQVVRLTELVDDLMDVTRIHNGRMVYKFEVGSLSETLREVMTRHEALFREHSCALQVRIAAELAAKFDRVRIEQVLMNLINNALKYAPGSPVEVEAYAEGEWIIVTVADFGPGIPPDFRERIFDRFDRGPNVGKISGGLGLGLFIVRQIVKAHGGSISLSDDVPMGSKFVVRIPREPVSLFH